MKNSMKILAIGAAIAGAGAFTQPAGAADG